MPVHFVVYKTPVPPPTDASITIEDWLFQSSGSYPDVTAIRVNVGGMEGALVELTDHLTGITGMTASVLQYLGDCDGFLYHETECNFTFTGKIGASYDIQIYYEGGWTNYSSSYIPTPQIIPNVNTTYTLGCTVI